MYIKKLSLYILVITIFIAIDQITKTIVIQYLNNQHIYSVELLPFLDIVYAWNKGISFGLFDGESSNLIFLIANSLVVLYLIALLIQNNGPPNLLVKVGLLAIIGGAIGNLIDRYYRGSVFDFIYFNYNNFSFPAFNLADAFIFCGVFCIILGYYVIKKKSLEEEDKLK